MINIIESILVPPLSDAPSSMTQLSDKEVDIVFKWLGFLKNYFNAYDAETNTTHGVPLDVLQGVNTVISSPTFCYMTSRRMSS